jgi:hypothetical protein
MVTGKTVGAVVGGLGIVLWSALMGGAMDISRGIGPTVRGGAAPWATHLAMVEATLARGDVSATRSAWRAAYGAALGSRRWDGFADVGDAYLRIGRASGAPASTVPRARDLYLSALFRARDAGSLDGVLRLAAAFDSLGDREVAVQALRMARRLAGSHPVPSVRDRLAALESERPATFDF